MLDCTELTYQQMADLVRAIKKEVKDRNPLFVNAYMPYFGQLIDILEDIGEQDDTTPNDTRSEE